MSSLFSKSAIRQAISSFEGLNIDKEIAIVQELYEDFRNGITSHETKYQQKFNELFFHQLLGYEPQTNYIPNANTAMGGKFADVGLGFFENGIYSYEGVRALVELKGSDTMLTKKQMSYGGQTPVDQGFGYITSFTNRPWLIVSNFISIRLYRDNKQDFEEWTIQQLIDPSNDYYHLKTLLALLKKNRLISLSGKSYTEDILSAVRIKQEEITKKFYKEYKSLRFELINDIRYNNPDLDVETVVEKSQKIIDRIVFILFCEDKGLLPDNKLIERVREFQKRGKTPWQSLLDHFQDIDKGNPAIGIPQYNGGLFHRDEVLKTIEVGDSICHKFIDLGKYNFDDELSVNILGHIFEQSISDIEQLKGELLGEEITTDELVEKKESKRKKDGIFYTPEYIVDYIVQNSLMVYLEEKENECLTKYKKENDAYQAYQHILQNIKVLDPACGSGAFLVKVFDYLYAENKRVGQIVKSLFDDDEIYKSILRNNIYGVDLNPESVEITKLSLWLKSAQKGKKLNNLDDNIKCGNSLIDDPAVAGERAFDWQKEFSDIMGAGGFDVIVGNPPYVAGKDLMMKDKEYFKRNYSLIIGKFDLYILFIERIIKLTKGKASIIIPNTILVNENGTLIRKYISEKNKIEYIRFFSDKVFSDANVECVILTLGKGSKDFPLYNNNGELLFNVINTDILDDQYHRILVNKSNNDKKIIGKINKGIFKLGDISNICIGIQIGGEGNSKDFKDKYISDIKKDDTFKKCIDGKDFEPYYISNQNKYVSYGDWLHRKRDELFFLSPKIIIRQIGATPVSTIDLESHYTLNTIYNLISTNEDFSIKYIFIIINSKLLKYFWLKQFSDGKDLFPKVKKSQLVEIPIKNIPLSDQQPFIIKADLMLSLNKELHDKTTLFLRYISSKFGLEKLSTKLSKFYDYDFATFLKELKGAKLSMTEEAEFMEFFETKKSEIVNLKNKIDATDREIDEMVFELYGLSEEERAVVMGK